jgi:hypothetical protein
MATATVILNCAQIHPTIAAVDHIARLQLGMKRAGYELRLANVGDELSSVIELAGLAAALRVEVQRQPEERKEGGHVQEEGDLADPPT